MIFNSLLIKSLPRIASLRILKRYGSSTRRKTDFRDFVYGRQVQAKQTVLVQVGSENSFTELFNYCLQFGEIQESHHYQSTNGENFILLQFSNSSSSDELLEASSGNESSLNTTVVQSPFLWFKTGKSPKLTKSTQYGKGVLSSKFGLTRITDDSLNNKLRNASSIAEQMKSIVAETELNDLSIRLRFLAARQIEEVLKGMFPQCVAYPFGSSISSFGRIGCDLDMILKLDNKRKVEPSRLIFHVKENFNSERSHKQRQMETIGDILHTFLPGVENVRKILNARVPIIKYHQNFLNLEVDLSLNDLSGLHMSELYYNFGKIDERVREIIFTVRRWAQITGLTNKSPGRWITNFSLSSLVIFFLQQLQEPLLPPINNFKIQTTSLTDDDRKKSSLKESTTDLEFIAKNNINSGELLLQFFEYYSSFDFTNRAISMNEGRVVNKPDHSAMYIINPFDKSLNISKNVSFEECERFRMEVRNAAWILESELENRTESMNNEDWGVMNLLKPSSIVKTNSFYRPRMVEVSDLFCNKVK